ncbi:MAG: nucleoside hydrolase [Chloroflexi bacterium]|nr:nucleoside hydrolase [Chloroflexota bacterium]
MPRLLIDTDPGTDDAIGLTMALSAPGVTVAGVTTVGGNASLAHVTKNTLALLDEMGRGDVPVARGASGPIAGDEFRHAYDYHGHRGVGVHMPRPASTPVTGSAAGFLASQLQAAPQPSTLVCLGPLTNIAHLLQQHSEAARSVGRLVVSGGATEDNSAAAYAQDNLCSDPEAAVLVLGAGIPTVIVPLEAAAQAAFRTTDLARWRDARTPAARLAHRILLKWFQRRSEERHYLPWDALTMALTLSPGIASYRNGTVSVDTGQGERRGRMSFQPGSGHVSIAHQVDAVAFHELLDCLFADAPGASTAIDKLP